MLEPAPRSGPASTVTAPLAVPALRAVHPDDYLGDASPPQPLAARLRGWALRWALPVLGGAALGSILAPELLAWWVATLALAVVATVVVTLVADPAGSRTTSRDARRRDR